MMVLKFLIPVLFLSLPLQAELTRDQAKTELQRQWQKVRQQQLKEAQARIEAKQLHLGEQLMKYELKRFGQAPKDGHSLFISMHGGGGAPAAVNDQQWQNQINLYQPKEGVYVAPRAPTNNWNLWHEKHIDDLFDRLIADFVIAEGVNPNRVYLKGYSAGGDGVYQLAPRMADRFAAAAMMAGHPNDASPLGLRNLPFALYMGGQDAAYRRNEIAAEWRDQLKALQQKDPKGYTHRVKIYPECGHWMNQQDAEALPWMARFTREPWPKKVIWVQNGGHLHSRYYWLEIAPESALKGEQITAEINGQSITITSSNPNRTSLILRLSDQLLDLDRPIRVEYQGKELFKGQVKRSRQAIQYSLQQRPDPSSAASALLPLSWEN